MPLFTPIAAILFASFIPVVAVADEDFLTSLHGNWAGEGMVTIRIGLKPIGVSCAFNSTGNGNSFSMNGNCRGLLIVDRAISAKQQANGTRYSGVYIGASGGRSLLSGTRSGDTINLAVRWAKEVNGDFEANMLIRKTGENGLSLLTFDRDPRTGRNVMISDIVLQRRL